MLALHRMPRLLATSVGPLSAFDRARTLAHCPRLCFLVPFAADGDLPTHLVPCLSLQ
jgi:hypothetical protein